MPKFISKAERLRRLDARIATYKQRHPERYRLWHEAMQDPKPCESCGAEGRPWFEPPPSLVIQGWRCYACRPATRAAE